MQSVILTEEGYPFLRLFEDGHLENLKTGTVYNQAGSNTTVIWHEGHSVSIPSALLTRKYFRNDIENISEAAKQNLGFLGLSNYSVTIDGRIWNHERYRWQQLIPKKDTGYVEADLVNDAGNTTHHKVHRLVAKAFKPGESESCSEIDHVDGNKTNNEVDNLEWVTPYENHHRARETGLRKRTLTDDQVHAFCAEWITGKHKTAGQCARALGLSVTACEHIINHGTHRDISGQYGIEYRKPIRLTKVDWSRYPKSKYLRPNL